MKGISEACGHTQTTPAQTQTKPQKKKEKKHPNVSPSIANTSAVLSRGNSTYI